MDFNSRSPFQTGAYVIGVLAVIIAGVICCIANTLEVNKHTKSTIEETTSWTSDTTTMTSTTTSTSTSLTTTKGTTKTTTTTTEETSSTTTLTTTVVTELVTQPSTQPQTQPPTEPPTESPAPEPVYVGDDVCPYSESDIVLLAQLINKESSSWWEGKIAVANCVLNRANANGQTISQVIYAPGQFTTAYSLGYYTTDDYNAALQVLTYGSSDTRIYYFDGCHPDRRNWFYDSYRNYLYAA